MARDKQKYNFLAALVRQVKEAEDDEDGLYGDWCELVRNASEGADVPDATRELQSWLAQVETRVEELEQELSSDAGEDADVADDGDDDEDVRGDEPRMGSDTLESRRVSANLAGAAGHEGGQPVMAPLQPVGGKVKRGEVATQLRRR